MLLFTFAYDGDETSLYQLYFYVYARLSHLAKPMFSSRNQDPICKLYKYEIKKLVFVFDIRIRSFYSFYEKNHFILHRTTNLRLYKVSHDFKLKVSRPYKNLPKYKNLYKFENEPFYYYFFFLLKIIESPVANWCELQICLDMDNFLRWDK